MEVDDVACTSVKVTTLATSRILASSSWCCGTASESAASVRANEDTSEGTERPAAVSDLTTNTYAVSGLRSVTWRINKKNKF